MTSAPLQVTGEMTFEEFLERYEGQRAEWVGGAVVPMSPIHTAHEQLRDYLRATFQAYFALSQSGQVLGEPQMMRLPGASVGRAPDLFIVLDNSAAVLRNTYLDGPADIAIEIVSPATSAVDRGEKFVEYEQGGVQEYWLLDRERREARFYRLQPERMYSAADVDADGVYSTPLLPRYRLHVATLWQDRLPDFYTIGDDVRQNWERG